jgi:HD-GYP domain-containing protein (c-di-GMP phosphodiesterase class II)
MLDRQGIGILIGLNKQGADFDSCDAKLLGSIAGQGSVFLANHRMYAELQDLLMGVLHSMTESIDAKDPYTCGHSRRVAQISRRLAISQGLDGQRAQHIYLSGLLHDIGKIGVPEAILCKDGRLTDEEYDNIKRHPAIGARILRRIRHLEPIVAGVLTHHERLDGTGYPKGLSGVDIPLEGRIVGLADSWDAMTSHRTYRRALDLDRAICEIKRCSGTQFDATLAEKFLSWDLPAYMEELQTANASDLHLLDAPIY